LSSTAIANNVITSVEFDATTDSVESTDCRELNITVDLLLAVDLPLVLARETL
jgi:hypothetical protein